MLLVVLPVAWVVPWAGRVVGFERVDWEVPLSFVVVVVARRRMLLLLHS